MISKNSVLLGMAAAVSASAIAVVPAQAEGETLVAQLRGYNFFSPIEIVDDEFLEWEFMEDVAIGRVVAKVGDICFVDFLRPADLDVSSQVGSTEKLACGWQINAGDDVIAGFDDDKWVIIDEDDLNVVYRAALPAWITRLDLKEEMEVQRTAIDWGDSEPVQLEPLRPQATTPAPAPEPIRGLW
ncbi:MAG: hypothetical protein AB4041_05490 [Microcystaceae cyanobacterium]